MRFDEPLLPEKFRVLSGSALKLIAVITMLTDHTASVVLSQIPFFKEPFFTVFGKGITIYWVMRSIGRTAFPIYVFLLTEGYIHTHDRKKYGINLLAFAIISEIPWNLEHSGSLFYSSQNVFFTLFLGYLGICAIEKYKNDVKKTAGVLILLFFISVLLRADYGCGGYGFILLMYVLRNNKPVQTVAGCCVSSSGWKTIPAFLAMNMYNGKRGFIHGKVLKYAFYVFYPAHMLALYFIRANVFGY